MAVQPLIISNGVEELKSLTIEAACFRPSHYGLRGKAGQCEAPGNHRRIESRFNVFNASRLQQFLLVARFYSPF